MGRHTEPDELRQLRINLVCQSISYHPPMEGMRLERFKFNNPRGYALLQEYYRQLRIQEQKEKEIDKQREIEEQSNADNIISNSICSDDSSNDNSSSDNVGLDANSSNTVSETTDQDISTQNF